MIIYLWHWFKQTRFLLEFLSELLGLRQSQWWRASFLIIFVVSKSISLKALLCLGQPSVTPTPKHPVRRIHLHKASKQTRLNFSVSCQLASEHEITPLWNLRCVENFHKALSYVVFEAFIYVLFIFSALSSSLNSRKTFVPRISLNYAFKIMLFIDRDI